MVQNVKSAGILNALAFSRNVLQVLQQKAALLSTVLEALESEEKALEALQAKPETRNSCFAVTLHPEA